MIAEIISTCANNVYQALYLHASPPSVPVRERAREPGDEATHIPAWILDTWRAATHVYTTHTHAHTLVHNPY